MQLKKLLTGAVASILFITDVFANSYGVPERPSNISPSDTELSVSISPTLTASEFVIKDDGGTTLENTTLTESEWLVYQNTGVTLVAGTNLTGAERDNTETVYFDVSASNLTLSGLAVHYAYVNHKRLELTDSSHTHLGYVELPNFIWQAENKDKYLAARFKRFDDAVVVEWTYGDDNAGTPWELQIQAILMNNLIGLKLNQNDFSANFVAAYGSETVGLCDETECFGHNFNDIYNTGNLITCSLATAGDSCAGAALSSGVVLDDMSISEVAYGTSSDTNFLVPTMLNYNTEYFWTSRQAGTLNEGSEISSGWSNETKFTTENVPVVDASNLIVEVITPDVLYYGQKAEVIHRITNETGYPIERVSLYISSLSLIENNDQYELPNGCIQKETYEIVCDVSLELDESYDVPLPIFAQSNLQAQAYIAVHDGLVATSFYNEWHFDLSVPNFSFELVRLSENIASTKQQFNLKVKNLTSETIYELELAGTTPGSSTGVQGEGCFLQENLYNLVCVLGDFSGEEEKEITFDMELNNSSEQDIILDFSVQLCQGDYALCWPYIKSETLNVVVSAMEQEVTDPEVTDPEVTDPEVTDPEVTDPEVTDPEATDPEVTDPEVTDPEVTDPEVTDPEVTDPEVTDPEVTDPEVTDPEVTDPEVTEPEVTDPKNTDPQSPNNDSGSGGGALWLSPLLLLLLRRKKQ